jgi:hypothetical protein
MSRLCTLGTKVLASFSVGAILLLAPVSHAGVIWNEGTNGDLSNNQAAPTSFNLGAGVSSVIGNVNGTGGDSQDWVEVSIPAGFQLSGYTLASYQSTDAQGFTGVQAGTSFTGSPFTAGSYLGYSHFGTGAQNGSLPAGSNVGLNLLPIMGDNVNNSPGSLGFTPPLPSGAYTFLIQQLGASTSYQFDFNVTQVPEPATLGLLTGGMILAGFSRARGRKMSAK